jgi:hypothetical protein
MTYSKIHQAYSEHLNQPDVLTDPGKYLGPNWEDVLNFWIYVDALSEQEREKMYDRYLALDEDVWDSAWCAAMDAANEVVGWRFRIAAWLAAYSVTGRRAVFGDATEELIGHHKLLEQNKTPTFLPLCVKP